MINETGIAPEPAKLRGEWAELRFMAAAIENKLRVIKPWGDCGRYDFVVEYGGRLLRIQVKSTRSQQGRHYACALRRAGQKRYQREDVDFFAVYIVPIDAWYIIPFDAVGQLKYAVSLSPHNSLSKMEVYREAWHLLRGEENQNPKP